ncbi:TRAP transporter substrate-binding protein DctP [Acuticoccus mangrovi]|uniref:TRAP transporter substrate-binding protein DctP n=1 Tax=Acuticoccus mangrovi TaxID=2796142 RepID=A0A934INB2_9HYPH|nr:TRAP transporter substrate-binding protein DctP [Acuticoccus mangrovi]MBJ3775745.1 TRAP transporter substrate-binding protein DctP [Acuticoccus mangrovi]
MTDRRTLLKTAVALSVGLPLAFGASIASAATYQAMTYLNVAEKPGVRGLQHIVDKVAEASDGSITFQINLAGSLSIKASDTTQALGDGVVQLADNQYYLGVVPIAGVLRLPALIETPDEYETAYKIVEPYMKKGFDRQGVKMIGHYLYPEQTIWGVGSITSLADLQGKKIRVTSAEQGKLVEAFGGFPITIPSAEIAPAIQRNLIDGFITASAGGARTLAELVETNYRLNTSTVDSFYMVNQDFYDMLPPAVQTALDEAGAEAGELASSLLAEEEPAWTKKHQETGVTVTPASDADKKAAVEAMVPVWEEWATNTGGDAPAVLAEIRKALGK